ncbi:hypothetical protein MHYP_G00234650 [Metynnis hypsauchen]
MPALGIPDPTKSFVQMVNAKGIYMTSVLTQKHGDKLRPVAYFSCKLDPVAQGLPVCLRAVAAAEKALVASRDIVVYAPLTLKVPHSVHNILQDQKVAHLSAQRWLRYHTALLDMLNVTVQRCTTLNPASLLPIPEDGEPHDCQLLLLHACTPRVDLKDEPLPNADLELFVDCSASKDETGINRVAYAVVSATDILHTQSLPSSYSAQAAELIALTKACELAEGKTLTVWTDSRYAWCVAHDFGYMWKQRNFLTSSGTKVKAVLPQPADQPFHDHKPGDWVLIRDFRRRRWNQPKWTGPHQVLLVTHTAVKVEGRGTWVHHTHCKKAPTTPEGTAPTC